MAYVWEIVLYVYICVIVYVWAIDFRELLFSFPPQVQGSNSDRSGSEKSGNMHSSGQSTNVYKQWSNVCKKQQLKLPSLIFLHPDTACLQSSPTFGQQPTLHPCAIQDKHPEVPYCCSIWCHFIRMLTLNLTPTFLCTCLSFFSVAIISLFPGHSQSGFKIQAAYHAYT